MKSQYALLEYSKNFVESAIQFVSILKKDKDSIKVSHFYLIHGDFGFILGSTKIQLYTYILL